MGSVLKETSTACNSLTSSCSEIVPPLNNSIYVIGSCADSLDGEIASWLLLGFLEVTLGLLYC